MKKAWIIIAAIVIVVLGAGAWWFMTHKAAAPSDTSNASTANSTDTTMPTTPAASTDVQSGTVHIDMKNTAYSPSAVTIKKGTTVVWTNQDDVRHNVVADDTNANNLPTTNDLFGKGGTYSFTFNSVGVVKYHCTVHPFMTAAVTVVE